MCLWANKNNPLIGKKPLIFDENGNIILWKIYKVVDHGSIKALHPPYFGSNGRAYPGWIRSKRDRSVAADKIAGKHKSDRIMEDYIQVNEGIHVYTSVHAAIRRFKGPHINSIITDSKEIYGNSVKSVVCAIVPVLCNKLDLVAMSAHYCQSVFTKVFLDKKDHNKATSAIEKPLIFDENGNTTCWKIYRLRRYVNKDSEMKTVSFGHTGFVKNGYIISDREIQQAGMDSSDVADNPDHGLVVNRGIHVYTTIKKARSEFKEGNNTLIVPVSCHKSDLVVANCYFDHAVFMKVFLKKNDYDKATKKGPYPNLVEEDFPDS